ncbi:DUF6705 family protein [Flavobacterium sp.]|jgi:hypothetical protein|uniref:DUF6705 family protein n=1 Tax=Flavobacterium sp. TaxID=239 RepID=UPI0037C1B0AE
MKTIVSLFLFLFSAVTLSAQIVERPIETFYEPNQPKHVYYKDVNHLLNKYVGSWEYTNGGHYFKITFTKHTAVRETPVANTKITIYTDRLVGNYQYRLNGIDIYNINNDDFALSTSGAFAFDGFSIFFDEPSSNPCGRRIMGDVNLIYSNTNGVEQINWNRTNIDWGRNCNPSDQTPFIIPANMVLTKT